MAEDLNMFIKPILMKKHKYDFKAWREKRRVIKKCKNGSPSFNDLCAIVEFLAILRNIYMYSNDDKFHLFLATLNKQYNPANVLAMVYKDTGFSITFIMFKDTQKTNIEITRSGQNAKNDKQQLIVDENYSFTDKYDEERMLFIVSSLMSGVIELIEYYYKHKKF